MFAKIECTRCQTSNPAWRTRCKRCDTTLSRKSVYCPACGQENPYPRTFCTISRCQEPLYYSYVASQYKHWMKTFRAITHLISILVPVLLAVVYETTSFIDPPPIQHYALPFLMVLAYTIFLYSLADGWTWGTKLEGRPLFIYAAASGFVVGAVLLGFWNLVRTILAFFFGIPTRDVIIHVAEWF